ncbi:MAG: tRNA dihydrouridine synthase DusB [Treponema sp.]|nr:tRNA dihydrouridine synthase DusB [Treponema sp.]
MYSEEYDILSASLYRPVTVGSAVLPGNLFLAPVAGYSDAAFRSVCAENGCDLAYTEMVSSEALIRGHRATRTLLQRGESEKLYAVQIFGSDPRSMARAAELLEPYRPALVDINCGCPVPKIVRAGAGSALLRDPALLGEIVRAVRESAPAPVTVKIRLGWDEGSVNYLETAAAAVEAGASAVTLHARTRAQGYSGTADWPALARLKASVRVPVFGSGDVFRPRDARRMIEETGVDGVMIARGAMGKPFIFRQARAVLEGREPGDPTPGERAAVARRHLALAVGYLGERTACVEFRKQMCAYTKGVRGGAELRAAAVKCSNQEEYEGVFRLWDSLS